MKTFIRGSTLTATVEASTWMLGAAPSAVAFLPRSSALGLLDFYAQRGVRVRWMP